MRTVKEIWELVEPIGSCMYEGDIQIYHKYLSLLPVNSTVLDVATGRGVSALAMAMSNPLVNITTIDDGTTIIWNKWAEDKDAYIKKVYGLCKTMGVSNISLVFSDFFDFDFSSIPEIDLFHVDDEDEEGKMLEFAIPHVKSGGILLVRNYNRFTETVDELCRGYEYLESGGLIKVIRKV